MTASPLVSVVVPTFNRKDLLGGCLDAILGQTLSPHEVIVADDGSTDGTRDFVRHRYGSSIKLAALPHSGLPGVVRDEGIALATGTHIAFCDSDDVWMKEKLAGQMRRLAETGCNFSCSDAQIAGEPGKTVLQSYIFRYADKRLDLLRENFVVTSSVVVERELLVRKQLTAPRAFPAYQDYVLWLGLAEELRIDFHAAPTLTYRRGGGISSGAREHDARLQLKIVLTQPVFRRHPFIAAAKALRYTKALLVPAA